MAVQEPDDVTQDRLVGPSPGDSLEFETHGRMIRPALSLPHALIDECKLRVDETGLQILAVDPANVGMIDLDIRSEAFDSFDAPDTVFGLNLDKLVSQLRTARMGTRTSDPIALDIDSTRTKVAIEREYTTSKLHRVDAFLNLDPDSIRQEPDLPDLDLENRASIDTLAFKDAVEHINEVGDHIGFVADGDDLVLQASSTGGKGDLNRAGVVTVEDGIVESTGGGSETLYSLDYVKDMASALHKAKVDSVQIAWKDEFPYCIEFERTDEDETVLYSGRYLLAPRIHQDGDSV